MPASIYAWLPEEREDEERKQLLEGLYRELDECTEVKITTKKPFENNFCRKEGYGIFGILIMQ